MKNQEIAQIFYAIADILEIQNVQWKPVAYRKAARALEALSEPIEDIYTEKGIKGLEKLPAIGKNLAEKIIQYIETGKIKSYEKLKKKLPKGFPELMEIQGLGPKKVKKLYKKLGIKNIKDLEKAAKKHKIKELETFKEKSEENILKGIELHKEKQDRMLLGKALPQAREIINELKTIKGVQRIEYAGSLRRMKETIGDIDLLVTTKNAKPVMNYFTSMDSVKRILAKGETKSAIILKTGIQVDLRVLKPDEFGAALQYFTGSKDHNIKLRNIAIKKGYKLSEYGLFSKKNNRKVAGKTENEIYRKLGMQYIEPEMRENTGEIEAAIKKKLPKLVTLKDIKGDLHMHTKASDGTTTIQEIAKACKQRNYEYCCITEHTKSLKIANGINEKKLEKQIKEIKKLNKKINGIKILTGIEVDILKDGSLDLNDKTLKKLDIVIASVHSNFKMEKKEMTKRLIKAMSNENVDILGHPTGRMIGMREAYKFDIDQIFQAAKDTNTALEINSQPKRMDLNGYMIKKAKEYKLKFVISTDAHNISRLSYMELGIAMARKGWCQKKDILNTLPLKKLMKQLK
ncbi:MAG: DNA polymerase/3'-5' exonuclease PolX [Nanoarchaeota archaeon]|nr:DNA polymerase/3'-5' exonuclease PolX [Nanoarchaeota archaeon]MCG2717905.1 DNA polymerase/3'-5' exonuclease PolX [Nanoarchaeota archaeon]